MRHLTLANGTPALISRKDIRRSKGTAVVDFRTLPNGAYRYMNDMRRGYWRVLEVRDVDGPYNINSHNVVAVLYQGPEGIDGVTTRSKYSLDESKAKALRIATQFNDTKRFKV